MNHYVMNSLEEGQKRKKSGSSYSGYVYGVIDLVEQRGVTICGQAVWNVKIHS